MTRHVEHEDSVRRVSALDDWVGPAAWGIAALGFGLGGEVLREGARYERAALADGELWRLLTGHLVHLGWGHLALNLAGLGVLWAIFRPVLVLKDWVGAGLAAAFAIDAGLYWGQPELPWYVGLSGVLHGFWATGALRAWRVDRGASCALGGLLFAKVLWEQAVGPVPLTAGAAGGPVVVDAHLFGAAGGVAWVVGLRAFHRAR